MTVEERLERVERSVRRWRLTAIATLVVPLMGYAGTVGVQDAIKTKTLEVVNAGGKVVARFDATKDGDARMMMYDRKGNVGVAAIVPNGAGGSLALQRGTGDVAVMMCATCDDGQPMVTVDTAR